MLPYKGCEKPPAFLTTCTTWYAGMEGEGKCLSHAQSGLLPDAVVGGGTGPGCFTHLKGIATTTGQLWWWEVIMTFLLVSVSATLLPWTAKLSSLIKLINSTYCMVTAMT